MSIALTLLEKSVIGASKDFQAFELRVPMHDTVKAFRDYTEQLLPSAEYNSFKVSQRRPVEIAVLNKTAYTVGTVRALNPTPNVITSNKVGLTFATKTFAFAMSKSLNEDNYIDYITEFQHNMFLGITSAIVSDANSLENQLVTYLSANKYATPPASGVPGVEVGTGSYEMSTNDFTLAMPVVMQELAMPGKLQVISNVASLARQRFEAQYGKANEYNRDQYANEMLYYKTAKLSPITDFDERHYVCPVGSLGLLNWVEYDARIGATSFDGRYTTIVDPFFGFQWGVFITEKRASQVATGGVGLERAVTIEYHFAADFAPVSPYTSTAGVTPIVAVDAVAPTP